MLEMTDNPRFCKKCLTRDMLDKDQYFKTLQEIIEHLDENIKTPGPLYEERLNICTGCERLIDGMCNACGCYVELRAAKKDGKCPYKKW